MSYQQRHELKNPQMGLNSIRNRHQSIVDGKLAISENQNLLGALASQSREGAAICVANGQDKSETCKELELASEFAMAFWQKRWLPDEELKITILAVSYVLPPGEVSGYDSSGDLLQAINIEILLRHNNALALLLGDQAKLTRLLGTEKLGKLEAIEIEILNSMVATHPHGIPEAPKWQEAWNNELLNNYGEPYLENLLQPRLQLWSAIIQKRQSDFDIALEKALDGHKLYWGSEENRQKKSGWISLPLLAACAYAYDHGMDLNVESDYIPRWLVTGDFS